MSPGRRIPGLRCADIGDDVAGHEAQEIVSAEIDAHDTRRNEVASDLRACADARLRSWLFHCQSSSVLGLGFTAVKDNHLTTW